MTHLFRSRWAALVAVVFIAAMAAPLEASAKRLKKSTAFCSRDNVKAYIAENNSFIDKESGDRQRRVVDIEAFYEAAKKSKKLRRYKNSTTPYAGTDAILNFWNANLHLNDHRLLAYVLASVWHETGGIMSPVREGFKDSDDAVIRYLDKNRKPSWHYYWYVVEETGQSYFGRGQIQLTWADNYKKADKQLGFEDKEKSLYWNPDQALVDDISTEVTFDGMLYGWYRPGYCLPLFIKPSMKKANFQGARDIVNGDYYANGAKIASVANAFNAVLESPGVLTTAAALEQKEEVVAEEKKKVEEEQKKAEEKAAQEKLAELEAERRRDADQARMQKIEADLVALEQQVAKVDAASGESAQNILIELRKLEDDQGARIAALGQNVEVLSDEVSALRDAVGASNAAFEKTIWEARREIESRDVEIDRLQRKVQALEACGFWEYIFGCDTGE